MSFEDRFNEFIPELTQMLSIPNSPDWSVKGFIDYYQNIYSISTDTKVVSKIIELMIFPKFLEFASRNGYTLRLSPHQNYYPDITFIDGEGKKYAVDLKSTYRVSPTNVNGMTLGAFTGYFRNRTSSKNVLFPYGDYEKHYVFGIIYSRAEIKEDETKAYNLENFTTIPSVVRDFDFFIQEKWKIASDRPGSGNTKNIGSESDIQRLKTGDGLFAREFGEEGKSVFDSYWINYQTKDMAKVDGRDKSSYNNLATYREWVESLRL
ncbi:MAG: type II restriction endonuclease [Sulfuricurvum sp.]|nr:type II restriction endonuclease [Sulfuricurvum sp.]MDD5386307.1 type II restriction endonuclease [Sulfuricurvum sp.]